jgi:hypothetical protein
MATGYDNGPIAELNGLVDFYEDGLEIVRRERPAAI